MTNFHVPSVLVLILGRDPSPDALADAAQAWEGEGATVSVLTLTRRARLTPAAQQFALLDHPVGPEGVDPSTAGEPRSTARKILRRLHLDPVRWAAVLLPLTSPRARALIAGADVVLAADPASIPLGWLLARRRGPDKVFRTPSSAARAIAG